MIKLCECGCGQETKIVAVNSNKCGLIKGEYRKFVNGHQNRNRHHSEATKEKMSKHHRTKRGFLSPMKGKYFSEESKKKMREAHIGQISSNKGKHHTEETKLKMRISHIDKQKGENHPMFGKHHSSETKIKMRASSRHLSGKNNHSWKGGITSVYERIRKCFEYRQWRSDIFTRDYFTCQECGDAIGGNLVAHHKIEFADILERHEITSLEEALKCEELWNINNGITLCEDCHIELHKRAKLKL